MRLPMFLAYGKHWEPRLNAGNSNAEQGAKMALKTHKRSRSTKRWKRMIALVLKGVDLLPQTFVPENKGRKGTYLVVLFGQLGRIFCTK
jgi:hypothetical protein